MSDAASPHGDPTDDALPDLTGGAGWDEPLADLAAEAPVGRLVDLGAGGAGADESPEPMLQLDGDLPDLTAGGGRSGRRPGPAVPAVRTGRRRGRRTPRDRDPAAQADTAAGSEADAPPTRGARVRDDPGAATPVGDTSTSEVPAGRYEPRTELIFGPTGDASVQPPTEAAPGGRGRRRRRGRTGDGEGGAQDATPTDRPLTAEERLQHAVTLAYRHLSKRDRTVSEVRAHLEKREIDEASIAGALHEVQELGYVDDERYAARFVEDKRRLEGWGHLRIEQGLRRTGVPREIADRALADDPLRGDEYELAADALDRRLAGRPLDDDRARQKALRLLATKGYPLETAYAAVRAYERRAAERTDD